MELQDILADLLGSPQTENAAAGAICNGAQVDKQAITETRRNPENQSWLDHPLSVSIFPNVSAQVCRRESLSLRELAQRIANTHGKSKNKLPLLKLAAFGDLRSEKGALRHDANVVTVSGIEGDYDAGNVSPAEAADMLRTAGIAALVYTTPSHRQDAPRWRVLCPVAANATPDERDDLCAQVNGALGGILAGESFTRSQSYYFGSTGTPPEIHLIDGRPIDQAPDLPRIGKAAPLKSTVKAPVAVEVDDLFNHITPDWDRIKGALRSIKDASDRDTWLTIGQALHHETRGDAKGFHLWCVWSKRCPEKFNETDQRRTWASFGSRKGEVIGIGSLFHIAKGVGWTGGEVKPPSRLSFLSPADCEAAPSRGYILKGMVAPGDVACIVGAPGTGKSLLAPYLAYMVAQGSEAFSMRTKAGAVFYVAAEDPHGMRGRVKALRATYGDAAGFQLVAGVSDLLMPESPDLAALRDAVEQKRPTLVVIDTLAMAFPGLEENSAEGMGRVVAAARSLTKWGAAVVLIHHDTKDGQQGLPRGHSLLNGALDVALHIKRDESGVVKGRLTKNRNGPCDLELAFTIGTIDAGQDEDGDPIRLPYARPCAFVESTGPKLNRSERAVLAHFEDIAGGGFEVSDKELRQVCTEGRNVSSSDDPDNRRRALSRTLNGLIDKGALTFGGEVWRRPDAFSDMIASTDFDDLPDKPDMSGKCPVRPGWQGGGETGRTGHIPLGMSVVRSDAGSSDGGKPSWN